MHVPLKIKKISKYLIKHGANIKIILFYAGESRSEDHTKYLVVLEVDIIIESTFIVEPLYLINVKIKINIKKC